MHLQTENLCDLIHHPLGEIDDAVERLAALIPSQGPIKDFIHHNTLHSFQNQEFGHALTDAAHLFGTDLSQLLPEPLKRNFSRTYRGLAATGIRFARRQTFDYDVDQELLPQMIRCAAAYFDQGLSIYPFPISNLESLGLFEAIERLVDQSWLPLMPFRSTRSRELLAAPAKDAIHSALSILTIPELYMRYLSEVLLALPGWAGLVRSCEENPQLLTRRRQAKLMDWLALFLTMEVGYLEWRCPEALSASWRNSHKGISHTDRKTPEKRLLAMEIEADLNRQEWQTYSSLLAHTSSAAFNRPPKANSAHTQVITCIDDREFSFRGILEREDSGIATFGAPGFFAVDCYFQDDKASQPIKHCPVPVNPKHLLRLHLPKKNPQNRRGAWQNESPSLLRGLFITQLFGLPAGIKLLLGVLSPKLVERRALDRLPKNFALEVISDHMRTNGEGLQLGYTVDQAVARVSGLLRTIGLIQGFAPLVCVVGHGASSVNNPYFSAYDCGACSGRPGGLNAYAFCQMINHPVVRERLREQGIDIPDSTRFIPLLHDTTADRLEVVGNDCIVPQWQELLDRLMTTAERELQKNALFRCRQFSLSGKNLSAAKAHEHVELRSVAWFEPRPEYNHATNISCVIGRRHLTSGYNSERAVFLHSYDPTTDLDGKWLSGVLAAVIPVCGGINLEYFFSRIDPEVYGAGSKLPHNVAGLVGVMTGLESDLRTGLPQQMTEIHEPLRLLILVEQSPAIVSKALHSIQHLMSWLDNRWVWLVAQDPNTAAQTVYRRGEFVEMEAFLATL
jgi:uncharacterized protein YbcC (UPF0753/DUF2309 family)